MESSNKQDSEDCVKRLICELHGSSEPLVWDERLIKNYIEPELDYTSPIIQFQLAANLGKRQVSACVSVYSRYANPWSPDKRYNTVILRDDRKVKSKGNLTGVGGSTQRH